MNKYCFTVERVIRENRNVIVEANSLEDAECLMETTLDEDEDYVFDTPEEEREVNYRLDLETTREDGTFDDGQFSDLGILVIQKKKPLSHGSRLTKS